MLICRITLLEDWIMRGQKNPRISSVLKLLPLPRPGPFVLKAPSLGFTPLTYSRGWDRSERQLPKLPGRDGKEMELGIVFLPRCLPLKARHSYRLLRQNGYDSDYSKHPALCPAPNRDLILIAVG